MKRILCGAVIFALLTMVQAQTDEVTLPAEVKALIPAKREILGAASADLNGDNLSDYVVVAQETESAEAEDPTRTVFVIEQKPEGEFVIAARNDRAVISKMNGGLSDSFAGITAEAKTFSISHEGGRRDKWHAIYTFGFSRLDRAWQLIRIEGNRWSEAGEVHTYKPPHDFGKIAFEEFDTEKWQGLGDGFRKSKLSKPKIPE
jgi:hypothetical protein